MGEIQTLTQVCMKSRIQGKILNEPVVHCIIPKVFEYDLSILTKVCNLLHFMAKSVNPSTNSFPQLSTNVLQQLLWKMTAQSRTVCIGKVWW